MSGLIDALNEWCGNGTFVFPLIECNEIISNMSPLAVAIRSLATRQPCNVPKFIADYDPNQSLMMSASANRVIGSIGQQMAVDSQAVQFQNKLTKTGIASYVLVYDYRLYTATPPTIYTATYRTNARKLDLHLYGLHSLSCESLLYTLHDFRVSVQYYIDLLRIADTLGDLYLYMPFESLYGSWTQPVISETSELPNWAFDFSHLSAEDIQEVWTFEKVCRTHRPVVRPESRRLVSETLEQLCTNIFQFWRDQR